MKDIFYLPRFWFLLKKTILERQLQIIGSLGLTMLLTWIFYISQKGNGSPWIYFQKEVFTIGLILGGGYLAATVFAYFSENSKGYGYLTLPTSQFEKWLCGFLIIVVFTVLYHVFFRLMDATYVTNYHNNLDTKLHNYKEFYNYATVMPFDLDPLMFVYKIYFNLTGFMAVAAFYFNKNVIVKAALLFTGLFIAGMYLNGFIAQLFFNSDIVVDNSRPFFRVSSSGKLVVMPENWLQPIDLFFLIALPAILWLVALLRLREKEF